MSKKQVKDEPNFLIKIFKFLTNKVFYKNLLYMFLVLVGLLILLNIYLRFYTNHGQKLVLSNFIDMHISDANNLAKKKSFKIIVVDSTHIVGKPGGIIINQNPRADALVKENRKVYVTVTKYLSDKIRLKSLPEMYGREFEQKKRELAQMKIDSRIKDYMYDPGEPNHILEVYYNGKLVVSKDGREDEMKIEKGGTLDFVLSKRDGLEIEVPNLICKTLAAAEFLLEDGARLVIGNIIEEGEIKEKSSAFVIAQNPSSTSKMRIGETIDLTISSTKPEDCN